MNRENKVENKSTATGIVIAILIMLIAVAGSFAYYKLVVDNSEPAKVEVKGKILGVNYDGGADISLTGVLPGQKFVKTITVTNTGNRKVKFDLELKDVTNEMTNKNELVYNVKMPDNTVTRDREFPSADYVFVDDYEIGSGEVKTFVVTIEYINTNSSQNVDMNKLISATFNVKDIIELEETSSSN